MTAAVSLEGMVFFGTKEFLVQQHNPKPSLNKNPQGSRFQVE